MERRGPAALPAPPLAIGRVPRRGQDLARAGPRRAARLGQHEDPVLPDGRRDQPEAARGRFLRPIPRRRHDSNARNGPFRVPGAAGRAGPPHARPLRLAPRSKTPLRPALQYSSESSEGRLIQQPRHPICFYRLEQRATVFLHAGIQAAIDLIRVLGVAGRAAKGGTLWRGRGTAASPRRPPARAVGVSQRPMFRMQQRQAEGRLNLSRPKSVDFGPPDHFGDRPRAPQQAWRCLSSDTFGKSIPTSWNVKAVNIGRLHC